MVSTLPAPDRGLGRDLEPVEQADGSGQLLGHAVDVGASVGLERVLVRHRQPHQLGRREQRFREHHRLRQAAGRAAGGVMRIQGVGNHGNGTAHMDDSSALSRTSPTAAGGWRQAGVVMRTQGVGNQPDHGNGTGTKG